MGWYTSLAEFERNLLPIHISASLQHTAELGVLVKRQIALILISSRNLPVIIWDFS